MQSKIYILKSKKLEQRLAACAVGEEYIERGIYWERDILRKGYIERGIK